MPHLILEHSGNLGPDADMTGLCRKLAQCLIAQRAEGQPIYPIGGVRVRSFAADAWCVADGASDAAYVHASLKVGAGRSPESLRATGDAVFAVMKDHFAALYARSGLALSLELNEFGEAGTWKHNSLHARYRKP